MTDSKVIDSRSMKMWSNTIEIQIIKDPHFLRVVETHTGPIPKDHCVEIFISLPEKHFFWKNHKGKRRESKKYENFFPLFKAVENKFIFLLSKHLKLDYKGERFGPSEYRIIRHTVKKALLKFLPEHELKAEKAAREKASVLSSLIGAKLSANVNKYPHIASELTRLIEEVKG